jgi:uncharacterized protein YndB with AHSA1/START domain
MDLKYMDLKYKVERSVEIQAPRETVFRYFTDSARWAKWWGAGSTIEPYAGGKVCIRHPNAVEVVGEVLEIASPDRIMFTWGNASGQPIPPGGSRVTIRLEPEGAATRLHLLHEFADAPARDEYVQGWRFQLALFANVVADEVFAGAASVVDAWYAAWTIEDRQARNAEFARIAAADVRFRDRYSLLDSVADLSAHAGAAQRFMPGIGLRRRGEIRQCQGMILAEWVSTSSDGKEVMSGSSVFQLGADAHIQSATSFTNTPGAG